LQEKFFPAYSKYDPYSKELVSDLLEEYFSIRLSDEALRCVVELKDSTYYPEFVKEAIYLGLDRSAPCVELVAKLLEYLLDKEILTLRDIGSGCLLYGSMLDDIGIDLLGAPNIGEIITLKQKKQKTKQKQKIW
jgi:translation initiation factor 4G